MKSTLNTFKAMMAVVLATLILPNILLGDWELQTNGLPEYTGSVTAIDACDAMNAIFADAIGIDTPIMIYKTIDGGESWTSTTIPGADTLRQIFDISMVDSDHIWVAAYSPPSIYVSTDGGQNWELQYSNSSNHFINYIEMFDTHNGVAMLDGDQTTGEPALFLTTSDGGENWVAHQQAGMPSYSYNLWHAIDFVNPNVGYFYKSADGSSHVWKTTDGCETWELLETPSENVLFPVVKFYDENIGVLAGENNIWSTVDGGGSWSVKDKPEASVGDVEFVPSDPSRIWISNYRDLLFTANGGAHWETTFSIFPGELADMVLVDTTSAWLLGTNGIYHISDADLILLNADQRDSRPKGYTITKVYPNPFNPSTTILYELPEQSMVTLNIYDIQGQNIQTLVSDSRPAGHYEAQWKGTDRDGRQVNTGMYFARLQAGDFSRVVKMVYLK